MERLCLATMKTLLIVYHTMTGGTFQMVNSACAGASTEPSLQVKLLRAPDAVVDDVLQDGLKRLQEDIRRIIPPAAAQSTTLVVDATRSMLEHPPTTVLCILDARNSKQSPYRRVVLAACG